MLIIVLCAQGTRQKSYGPILNLPILTDTDSNQFLKILTLPIPIFIHKYNSNTVTAWLQIPLYQYHLYGFNSQSLYELYVFVMTR